MRTYAPGGRAPREGDIFRNPDLARTYRAIAEGGREVFYDGPIARTIDAYFKRIGGWLSREDLRDQHAEWVEPLVTSYRGVDVYAMGANTQGLATLQMLNILEHFDLSRDGLPIGRLDSRAGRGQASGLRGPRPLLRRSALLEDSRRMAELESLRRRARQAHSPRSHPAAVAAGEPPSAGDTTYLTVADSSGMMVSMIQSNYRGMGSGLVADGLGFMFQDRGQLFSLEDGHPNLYQPGKRPFHTIIPGFAAGRESLDLLRRHGRRHAAAGPNADHGEPRRLRPRRAGRGRQPRWHHVGSSQRMGEDEPGLGELGRLHLESGVPERSRRALADLGWPIGPPTEPSGVTNASSIASSGAERVYAAASEMRADGVALAY
jgi:gamma-glutamyltranspeptidase/glutathione hydrolase